MKKTAQSLLESYVKKTLDARIYDLARETPLDLMEQLSARLDNTIALKREDTQPIFSFKVRGAYNKTRQLEQAARESGILTVSAGNHAQGVAIAARKLDIKATIVMPRTTPETKVRAVRSYGARSLLHGDNFEEAFDYGMALAREKSLEYIPPFDDPEVIAGQGTIAAELLRQTSVPIDAVFVPVGGGGLAAGITAYIKFLHPEIKVFAVEPEDANCLDAAISKGRRVVLKQVGLFADGVAVRQIGKHPFAILKDHIDGVICVTADEICAAVKDTYDDHRSICEPAGAIGLAGLKKHIQHNDCTGQHLIAINSGANTTLERVAHMAERAEIGERREAVLAVTLKEQPGSFRRFCQLLQKRNITEFNYRYSDSSEAHVFVGIRLGEHETTEALVTELRSNDYQVTDMTDNSMAKTHVRHMVGGHTPAHVNDERIIRVTFPERPGALLQFLRALGNDWNISLFHYRNHGAAYGRVLVGIQVPEDQRALLRKKLDLLNYDYAFEQDNPAYSCFLN